MREQTGFFSQDQSSYASQKNKSLNNVFKKRIIDGERLVCRFDQLLFLALTKDHFREQMFA